MVKNNVEPLTKEEEIACLRAVLERILNHLNSGLFKDYQLEKWGRIVKSKEKLTKKEEDDYERFV